MKSALILYPHQLYAFEELPQVDTVIVVEEPLYFGVDQQHPLCLHKQKLILLRASMRRYVEEVLWPHKVDVDYVELDVFMKSGDVLDRLKKFDHLYAFDPVDEILTHRMLIARRERPDVPAVEFLPSPNFYLKEHDVRQYFATKHDQPFSEFYQWQRERFNVLIGEDYKPVGGSWLVDTEKSKKLDEGTPLPSFGVFGDNKWVKDATKYVQAHFPNNPGDTDFIWPTNHQEAETWLRDFVKKRLNQFAPYEEALDNGAAWTYHSALSASLNIGLLSPKQVLDAALQHHIKQPVPLPSLEAFVRQVLGWREFTRALYVINGSQMRAANPLAHKRRLTNEWYDGTLGIPPFDDMMVKIHQHAYAHHAERLSIAGNLMLLCEIDPLDMQRWFGELFVDAYDWAVLPHVYSMNQLNDQGGIASHLAISNTETLLRASHYQRGEWSDIWDGLFWRFVEKHKESLHKNPRIRTIVQRLEQLDPDHKRIIHYRAEDFLARATR